MALALPALPGASAPAVRRPVAEVDFGGSAGDWASALLSITVDLGTAPGVDAAELRLAPIDGKPAPAVGDAGTIKLGFDDGGAELVFTGVVELVARDVLGTLRVVAVNGAAAIARLRLNRSFEQRGAADVIKDLIDAAGASGGSITAAADLPFYVVDDRRSGWRQIADLARDCGSMAYVAPDGKVTVAPAPAGPPAATLSYAQDILELLAGPRAAGSGAITVLGEGAAGGEGSDAWNWLVKDPSSVKGSAGSGKPERLTSAPWLRSQSTAQAAADGAAAASAAAAVAGRVLATGNPKITVGSGVAIAGAPDGALNGDYVAEGVRHRFAGAEGFTTLVRLAGAGGGGGLP